MKSPLALLFASLLAAWALEVFAEEAPRVLTLETRDAKREGGGRYDPDPKYRCIRDWLQTNMIARWTFDLPARGTYRVIAVYACDPKVAGSTFEIEIGNQKANGTVQSTDRWENFKEYDLGPVLLRKPGPLSVTVRVTRIPRGTAWDLRLLRLVPDP